MKVIYGMVTSRGRVTIPAAIREQLGVPAGGRLLFAIGDNGRIELRSAANPTVASLRGVAGSLDKPLSWHEMRALAREDHLSSRYRRGRGAPAEESGR